MTKLNLTKIKIESSVQSLADGEESIEQEDMWWLDNERKDSRQQAQLEFQKKSAEQEAKATVHKNMRGDRVYEMVMRKVSQPSSSKHADPALDYHAMALEVFNERRETRSSQRVKPHGTSSTISKAPEDTGHTPGMF